MKTIIPRLIRASYAPALSNMFMNKFNISLRAANLSDLPEIQKLFVKTIMAICKDNYSPEQLEVWTSAAKNTERWANKIITHYFLVAELDNKMIGFASLDDNDYVDLLFVHKDYQRRGIADKLYSDIEKEAIKRKIILLHANVSITAKSFFENKAFKTVKEQKNIKEGVEIINYKMIKTLSNFSGLAI